MREATTVVIDQDTIKFTPDGKVDVMDAIATLCGNDQKAAQKIWQRLIKEHPEAVDSFEDYRFSGQERTPVADSRGWSAIQAILFDYMLEHL